MNRVQFNRGSTNIIMVPHRIPIPNGCDDIKWSLGGDVDGIVPSRVEIIIDDSRFRNTFLIFIRQNNVRIASSIHITRLQVFGLHNFNCEDIGRGLADLLELGSAMLRNHLRTPVNIDFMFQPIELCEGIFNIV